jgi:DNA invertase Pin-like site-specific DNA recombinase
VRVALYARVSTPNGQHPEVQLAELREHAARRGWEIVREYIDQGITGARERRPELDRLWVDCRKRKVDAVLVYRYDRFARSLRQLVNALEEFRALGIDFVSLHEGVDTSTPNGRLVFGIFASIAEFERELIRGRVISGLAAAQARGVRLGRPRTSVDADQIASLRASGASWREISETLGIGVGTACRAFQSLPKTP